MNAVLPLLLSLLMLRPAPPGPGQGRAQDAAAEVAAILARTERPADAARAARELAALGDAAVGLLFDHLVVDTGDLVEPGRLARRAAILGALASIPSERVLAFLTDLGRHPGDGAHRRAGLDLLARLGGRAELPLALELCTPDDPDALPDPDLRAAFEAALTGIVARDRGAARALLDYFPRCTPAAQASIVEALARIGGSEAVGWLAGLLGSAGSDADTLLLLRIGALARVDEPASDQLVLERVRACLGHPDARLVVLATVATVALSDDGAVPDLIVLLEDTRTNVRRSAHAALVGLTGTNLAPESQVWLSWLDDGLAWWDERADPCRAALGSGPPAEAAAALQEVARQRLFVHEVVPLLQLATQRAEPDLVRAALRALAALPARSARAALAALPPASLDERARAVVRFSDHPRPSASRARHGIPLLSRTP